MTDNPITPETPEDVAEVPGIGNDEISDALSGTDDSSPPIIVKSTESHLPEISVDSSEADTADEEESDDEPSEDLQPRLERLGGEPAPDITPEEFARLQQSGQIHIDPRGRVRSTARSSEADAGVSLRKRRAWY